MTISPKVRSSFPVSLFPFTRPSSQGGLDIGRPTLDESYSHFDVF
jgi:hypothetical protein